MLFRLVIEEPTSKLPQAPLGWVFFRGSWENAGNKLAGRRKRE